MLLPLDTNGLHVTVEDGSQLERRFKESFDQYVSSGENFEQSCRTQSNRFRQIIFTKRAYW